MPTASASNKLLVSDVMSTQLLLCQRKTPLIECAKLMREHNVSSIFVEENGQIIGIWTEADSIHLDFSSCTFQSQSIEEVMNFPVKRVTPNTLLSEVTMQFHSNGLRHLLVTDRERPVGVISLSDVVHSQGLEHYLHFKTISESYCRKVPIVDANAPIEQVTDAMQRHNSNYVLIENKELSLSGIITERDVLNMVLQERHDLPCWQHASWPLMCVNESTSLFKAYQLLKLKKIRHLVVENEAGNLVGVLSLKHIMTEIETAYMIELEAILLQRDHALKKSEKNLYLAKQIINASLDGIMITNSKGEIMQVNPAFTQLTGFAASEVEGKRPNILSSGRHDGQFYDAMWQSLRRKGVWQGEIYNRKKNGEIYLEWLTIIEIKESEEEEVLYAAIFSDITERKRNEKRIKTLAYFDELTHLPNRRLFSDRLEMALATAHRDQQKVAVMFLDLDHFKQVNDTLGHSVGDELLQQVAKRLQSCLQEGDTLARLGGDEFTLLLTEENEVENIQAYASSLINVLKEPFYINQTELSITTSIGGAIYPDDGADSESLLKHADIAMYRSKELGRNSFQLFKPAMNARSLERMAIEKRIKKALQHNEFELYYQPKVDAKNNALVGLEALVRWQDPELGFVSPACFIPLAEEIGIIVDIDLWVLDAACRQISLWQQQGVKFERVSINVSALHFTQGNLIKAVEAALLKWQVAGRFLEIEITESSFIRSLKDAKKVLNALKLLGVKLALDDFGTGYSALSYLTRLPIDVLKIDASFIAKVPDEYGNSQIVRAIVALAHSLNLELVAEGVEKQHQLDFLQQLNCHHIQGYFYSKPLTVDEFERFSLPQKGLVLLSE